MNLGGTFGQLVGPPEIQAVAQVVFTASALPGVTGVTFELAGQPVEVPVASGAQVPVATTAQFAAWPLAPLSPRPRPPRRDRPAVSPRRPARTSAPLAERRGALPHRRSRS